MDTQGDSKKTKATGPLGRPYQKPELVRWGSLLELTRGDTEGLNSDADFFTGSGGV